MILALLTLGDGDPPVTGSSPNKGPVMRNFYVFFLASKANQTVELKVTVDVMALMHH